MERLTPKESLKYAALTFERAVLITEQAAITCDVSAVALQVARQETRLAVTRHRRAKNQLAQAIYKSTQREFLSHDHRPFLAHAPASKAKSSG